MNYNRSQITHFIEAFRESIEQLEQNNLGGDSLSDAACKAFNALAEALEDAHGAQGYHDAISALLSRWYEASRGRLEEFSAIAFSSSLYAHAKLGLRPDAEWLAAWAKASRPKLDEFTPQHLANSFYAHAKLGLRPDAEWLAAWVEASRPKLDEFSPQDLVISLYAHARLGLRPDAEWLTAWAEASLKKLSTFGELDYASSLYSLAICHVLGAQDCRNIATKLLEDLSAKKINKRKHSFQIYLACLTMDLPLPESIDQQQLYCHMKQQQEHEINGSLEHRLGVALKHSGFTLLKERMHPVTLAPLDYVAECDINGEMHRFFIQFDGPSHYIQNPDGSMIIGGKTLLQNHLIQQSLAPNEHLVRFDYRDVYHARDLEGYVIEKIVQALREKPDTKLHTLAKHERIASRRVAEVS